MALDVNAIKARLAQLANNGKKKSTASLQWKPKDEHTVRLLPLPGNDDPFVERHFHYDIGSDYALSCPKNYGEDCCICEFAEKLRSWKDERGKDKPELQRKADFEMFKKLQSKPKYYVPIIERGKEAGEYSGPFWWSVTSKVYNDLLKICVNEDWNEGREDGGAINILVSPEAAHDVNVSYKKPGEKGNKTTMHLTDVEERKKTSKLHSSQKEIEKILSSIPNIDEVVERKSSKEVLAKFTAFVNADMSEDKAEAAGKKDVEYAKNEKAPVASNNAEKLTGTRSIDDAFDDLVNEK